MSKTVLRTIEDIGPTARHLAQEAAQRLGMPVDGTLDVKTANLAYETMLALSAGAPNGRGSVSPLGVVNAAKAGGRTVPAEPTRLRTPTDISAASFRGASLSQDGSSTEALTSAVPLGAPASLRRVSAVAPPIDDVVEPTPTPPYPARRTAGASAAPKASPALSRLARTDDGAASKRPVAAHDDGGRSKAIMIREAVNTITRRQNALELGLPSRDPGASTVDHDRRLGKTVSPPVSAGKPSLAFKPPGQNQDHAAEEMDRVNHVDERARQDATRSPLKDRYKASAERLATTRAASPAAAALPGGRTAVGASTTRFMQKYEAESIWSDIRALLDHATSGASVEVLDRRMQELAGKVEKHLGAPCSTALVAGLLARVDMLQSAIPAPIEREMLEQLLTKVEQQAGATRLATEDLQRLDEMMNTLAQRIEEAHDRSDTQAFSTLEAQIERLNQRLESSEANLSSLDAIDQSLRDLFTQIESTREATIEAAENSARIAARDTLYEAMQNPALTGLPDLHLDVVEKVANEVQDLKIQHDACERRTQAALSGLHRVIERLVERLAETTSAPKTKEARQPIPVSLDIDDTSGSPYAFMQDRNGDESRASWPGTDHASAESLIEPGERRGLGRDTVAGHNEASDTVSLGAFSGQAPSFIAAARDAARAAQVSAQARGAFGLERDADDASSIVASALALLERTRNAIVDWRRPLTVSLASAALVLCVFEVSRVEIEARFAPPSVTAGATSSRVSVAASPKPAPAQSEAADWAGAVPTDMTASITPGKTSIAASPLPSAPQAPAAPSTPVAAGEPDQASEPGPAAATAAAPVGPPAPLAPPDQDAFEAAKPTNPFLDGAVPGSKSLSEGLKAMATAGDPAAQYEVGMRFVQGRSVARDPKMAVEWFEKAAAQGFAPAQYRLGLAFEKGVGEPRDAAQAMVWYGRAAEAGNIRAMHNLAVMTAEAAAGKPNYAKAAALFGKAAALGVRDSQFNLAILYAKGLGVDQNLVQSYLWFALAAAQGDEDAAKKREDVAARLDAKSLAEAKAAVANFQAGVPVAKANDVPAPAGGWDAVAVPLRSGQKASSANPSTM